MSKLTLSIDNEVVARARRYAKQHGVSISAMVEAYLAAVAEPATPQPGDTPILRSLRGCLKTGAASDYHRHLAEKHR